MLDLIPMNEKPNIAILILAAGTSSRMGNRIKQLLPLGDTTLLGNAIEKAEASMADDYYIILGAHIESIKATMKLDDSKVIHNPNWQNGLGSSIAIGINHLVSNHKAHDAVLIMLADQPLIDTDYLNAMMVMCQNNKASIVTTAYKNRSGVPAIFAAKHFSELKKLNKDFGAKDIINQYKDANFVMNPDGKEVDIDTWDEYQKLHQSET